MEFGAEQQAAGEQAVLHPVDTAAHAATNAVAMEGQMFSEYAEGWTHLPPSGWAAPSYLINNAMATIGLVDQIAIRGSGRPHRAARADGRPASVHDAHLDGARNPHAHTHPPSLIPPAPPCPLPSLGAMLLPGALSVLVGGLPAARAGDVGMIVTCVSLGPPVEVAAGSSNTFFAGARAARVGTDLFFHDNPSPLEGFALFMAVAGAVAGIANAVAGAAEGNFASAGMSVAQAAADAGALALKQLRKIDPGIPPDFGVFLTGDYTVLVGGIPLPPAVGIDKIVGALRRLGGAVARRLNRGGNYADQAPHHCGTANCAGH